MIYVKEYKKRRNTIKKHRVVYTVDEKYNDNNQEIIDICLNCVKKKCNGNCAYIRRKINEAKIRNN